MNRKQKAAVNAPRYRCPHCGKVVERESGKQWIKSYCDETGRYVRLQRLKGE